jgi:hypothetical protein
MTNVHIKKSTSTGDVLGESDCAPNSSRVIVSGERRERKITDVIGIDRIAEIGKE